MIRGSMVDKHVDKYMAYKPLRFTLSLLGFVLIFFTQPMWCEINDDITVRFLVNLFLKKFLG
jgi:hypothetical protein